jgi:hypothetical protein
MDDQIYSSAVIDANGNIFFGCADFNLYSLDSQGKLHFLY